jgi:hypothetical protein
MPEEYAALSLVLGGSAGGLILKMLWERFVRKAAGAEDALEREREERQDKFEAKLELLQHALAGIQSQLGVLLERLAFNSAEFRRIDERQQGMSINHGARLTALEADVTRLKTLAEVRDTRISGIRPAP